MKKVLVLTMAIVLIAGAANAAIVTVGATAPVEDGLDVANYVDTGNLDKWFYYTGEAASKVMGQTFTSDGSGGVLNAITYEIADDQKTESDKHFLVSVSTINKVDPGDSSTWILTEIYSENGSLMDQWIGVDKATELGVDAAPFVSWTFDTPLALAANTEYAVGVGMLDTSTGHWSAGIPYIKFSNVDQYAGGTRYMSGTGAFPGISDGTMSSVSGDRVFHLDIVPEPATMMLLGLGGLLLRRKR